MVRFIDGTPAGAEPKHVVEISCGISGTFEGYDEAERQRDLIETRIREIVGKCADLRVVEMRSVVVEEGQDGDTDNSGGDR